MDGKENLHMVMDDTAALNNKSFPETPEKDREFFAYVKSLKNKYMIE